MRYYKAQSIEDYLDHYTDKSGGAEACWPWTGTFNRDGYGRVETTALQRRPMAHKEVWELRHGHERTPDNTYVSPNGRRECRICHRLRKTGEGQHACST
jgi:hypothetical protein